MDARGHGGHRVHMKVLLSAYACAPDGGSERAVGVRAMEAAARRHDVWVLTQPEMASALQAHVLRSGLGDRVTIRAIAPDVTSDHRGVRGLVREQLRHDLWQRNARREALALDAKINFDVVHHVTLASYWMRVGVAALGKPLVWGPVGGGVATPWTLLPMLGVKGLLEDAIRATAQRGMSSALAAPRAHGAKVVFVQNHRTAARLDPRVPVTVLPNPLAATVPTYRPERRTAEVAVVGRLIPWKATTLAIAAMRHVTHPDALMRIYGTGREADRVHRAIARSGLGDRIRVEGFLPHDELLHRVAASGALLHPALHEEGGFAVAEALSLGTPVVTLAHGGPGELLAAWPHSPSASIAPRSPARTARAMGAAVDRFLAARAPVPAEPLRPVRSFGDEILAAYELAAADRNARASTRRQGAKVG